MGDNSYLIAQLKRFLLGPLLFNFCFNNIWVITFCSILSLSCSSSRSAFRGPIPQQFQLPEESGYEIAPHPVFLRNDQPLDSLPAIVSSHQKAGAVTMWA